jgi:hypothetical protein
MNRGENKQLKQGSKLMIPLRGINGQAFGEKILRKVEPMPKLTRALSYAFIGLPKW